MYPTLTDVDDKIIKKAIEEGVSAEEISQRYIEECKKDMAGMNVKLLLHILRQLRKLTA